MSEEPRTPAPPVTTTRPGMVAALVAIAAVVAVCGCCAAIAPDWVGAAIWHTRESLYVIAPLLALLAIGVACITANRARNGIGLLAALVLGIITFIWWAASWHGYQTDRAYYTASVHVTADPVPALKPRQPYQMAVAQARSNLGDIPGEIQTDATTYLPRRKEFGTLVTRRGWLSGYEAVLEQKTMEDGNVEAYTCRFDHNAAARRDAGSFAHKLSRAINAERPLVRYDPGDIYGYCDADVPVVVIPLKQQTGWLVVTERPAGYALYNGRTGRLSFHDDGYGMHVPGPTYPLSLAERQRQALNAPGGYWDYRADRTGWEPDPEDVNSGNTTEFTLGWAGTGDPIYVTPLTGRGSATAISAVAVIDASARPPGHTLARLTVHRQHPSWKSTKAIESRIKTDYQDLPNWQNVRVFEVAPTGADTWVATVGIRDGNTISYRIHGTGTLTGPKATCLHRADNDKPIRCGRSYFGGEPAAPAPGTPQPVPSGTPGPLASYSDEQLVGELNRRLHR